MKRKKKRRGQLLSQPFIYIFALIVGALILIWGFNTVMKLGERADTVALADCLGNLENTFESYYYLEEGSQKTIPSCLPKGAKYMCIIDGDEGFGNCKLKTGSSCPMQSEDFEIFREWDLIDPKYNVHILPMGAFGSTMFQIFEKGKLKTKEGSPLCFKIKDKITITNKGTYVEVS